MRWVLVFLLCRSTVAIELGGLRELVKRREILLAEIDRDVVKGPERGGQKEKAPLFSLWSSNMGTLCLSVISISATRSMFGFQKKDQDSNTDCKESARVLTSTVSTLRLYGGLWVVVCV